jgi:hypothetical protein
MSRLLLSIRRPVVDAHEHWDAVRRVAHDRGQLDDVHTVFGRPVGKGLAHGVEAVPNSLGIFTSVGLEIFTSVGLGIFTSVGLNQVDPLEDVPHVRGQGSRRDASGTAPRDEHRLARVRRSRPHPKVVAQEPPRDRADRHPAVPRALALDVKLGTRFVEVAPAQRRDLFWASATIEHDLDDRAQAQVDSRKVCFQEVEDERQLQLVEVDWAGFRRLAYIEASERLCGNEFVLLHAGDDRSNGAAVAPDRRLGPSAFHGAGVQKCLDPSDRQLVERRLDAGGLPEVINQVVPNSAVVPFGACSRCESMPRPVAPEQIGEGGCRGRLLRTRSDRGRRHGISSADVGRLDDPFLGPRGTLVGRANPSTSNPSLARTPVEGTLDGLRYAPKVGLG